MIIIEGIYYCYYFSLVKSQNADMIIGSIVQGRIEQVIVSKVGKCFGSNLSCQCSLVGLDVYLQ